MIIGKIRPKVYSKLSLNKSIKEAIISVNDSEYYCKMNDNLESEIYHDKYGVEIHSKIEKLPLKERFLRGAERTIFLSKLDEIGRLEAEAASIFGLLGFHTKLRIYLGGIGYEVTRKGALGQNYELEIPSLRVKIDGESLASEKSYFELEKKEHLLPCIAYMYHFWFGYWDKVNV
jgi:hypothetical protein